MDRSYVTATVLIAVGFVLVILVAAPGVPILPVIVVAGGVAGLFFLFWFFGTYLPLRRFKPLEKRFGFRSPKGAPEVLTGTWEGLAVAIRYEEWRRSERARLYLEISHDVGNIPSVLFQRESFFNRLSKGIGLSKEVQSGDPRFDSRVYAESEDDRRLMPLLNSPDVRSQVLSLLEIRRSSVSVTPDAVTMTIRGHVGWTRYFQPDQVATIFRHLTAISRAVSAPTAGEVPPAEKEPAEMFESRTFKERMALLRDPAMTAVFVASLLLFVGPILFIWGTWYPTLSWRFYGWGSALALISLVLYVPLTFSLFRGRSHSHREFSTFLLIGAIAFPMFWIGLFTVANGFLDRRPPFIVQTQVMKRLPKESRLGVYLDLGRGGRTFTVRVSPLVRRSVKMGQPLPVLLSPGALNEPWVVGSVDEIRRFFPD